MTMPSPDIRNFDAEAKDRPNHRYAYDFDYRMHRYMMRTFAKSIVSGNALELGCYQGHFTKLLCSTFSEVDVVDASADCIAIAQGETLGTATFHHYRFEDFLPGKKYRNIFLVHTLEHLDEPKAVLARIRTWLAPGGRLFIASPNAHAGSRQIAVAMGLIAHTCAVTDAERAHGHRVTYSFDTLEADLRGGGLHAIDKGGIFFKGLANFQLDRAFETGIISAEYLDGCYELGSMYPDLCSSIYFVCESAQSAQ